MREFGSEHPAIELPDGYFDSLHSLAKNMFFFRSGREALMFAGANITGNNEKKILLPSYCCWSMRVPFEKLGWSVEYYRLNEDLTVDADYLEQLLILVRPQAILTMNFYGSASTANAIGLVKAYDDKIQVIEDFTHSTFCLKSIYNSAVDFYVSSIRKSIGVNDGAIVLTDKNCALDFVRNCTIVTDFTKNRNIAQRDKMLYTWSKSPKLKTKFLNSLRDCEMMINDFDTIYSISEYSRKMLQLVNGEHIAYARRKNMKHLWEMLNGKIDMIPGLERSFESESSAPFSLPILVKYRDVAQIALAKRGLYTQLLWPISEKAQQVCSVAKKMHNHMLSVPIDQRYSWDDIEEIASIVLKTCK